MLMNKKFLKRREKENILEENQKNFSVAVLEILPFLTICAKILQMASPNQTNLIDLANKFEFYFAVTLVPIGIATNLLSAVVFLRKNLSSTNMGFFYFLISSANLITLLYYLFFTESLRVFHYDLSIDSDFACKFLILLRRVVREIAPIVEIIMTLERFMSVYFPKRFILIQKRWFLLALISFIFAIFVVFSFENLFYYLDVRNGTRVCTSTPLVATSSDLVSATLRTFVPFTAMLTLNILMVRRLIKRRIIRSSSKSRREYQFTISVISMNVFFLALNFPVSICYILRAAYSGNSREAQIIEFSWRVAYLVATCHYIFTNLSNFIFNRLFREELFRIFGGEHRDSVNLVASSSSRPAFNFDTLDRPK